MGEKLMYNFKFCGNGNVIDLKKQIYLLKAKFTS